MYDLVSLGGGPGGSAAAQQAALRGGSACIIEERDLGGVCLNRGCMPTKALLAASEAAWAMRRTGPFGIRPVEPEVDGRAVMRRVAEMVRTLRQATEEKLASRDRVDVLPGRGRLTAANTVEVDTPGGRREIRGRSVVIATGSRPNRPDFLPWDSGLLMTSDEALAAEDLPASVLVMGGGPLGCEFATAYAELGAEVHVVEMADRLLGNLPEEASDAARELLARRGVVVHTGATVQEMKASAGRLVARLADGDEIQTRQALIAVGRSPNVEDIGLERIGLRLTDGIIPVDDRCRTQVDGVYAVGDVADPRKHSHLAERMGVVAGENAMGYQLREDRSIVPVGVYTHPQIACAGTCDELGERPTSLDVAAYAYADSGTAKLYDRTGGRVKLLVEPDTGRIRGGLWIGPGAIDMIHEVTLAMRNGVTLKDLFHTMHAHPSFQEAVHAAAEAWIDRRVAE